LPLLAAAPFLARAVGRRTQAARDGARADADWLEAIAPNEPVLFVDPSAAILAGTSAGFAALGLAPSEARANLAEAVAVVDRPALLRALLAAADEGQAVEIDLDAQRSGGRLALTVFPSPQGREGYAVRIRPVVRTTTAREGERQSALLAGARSCPVAAPSASVREAIGFALRRMGPRAQEVGVTFICRGAGDLSAGCEATLCRRIVALALEIGAAAARPGGTVAVVARALRGAVLIRISPCVTSGVEAAGACDLDTRLGRSGLRDLVEEVGGSVLVETRDGATGIAIRLPSATGAFADPAPRPRLEMA
jgi:hypothetical protein